MTAPRTESEPTPGPWIAAYQDWGPRRLVIDAEGAYIATVAPSENEQANASLIAAAPETAAERDRLREALEAILELDDLHGNEAPDCECSVHTQMAAIAASALHPAALDKAAAAIAKARGAS